MVFDSTVPIGGAEAVYWKPARAALTGAELEPAIATYSQRSSEVGGREWTVADVSPPAPLRLYRATASAAFVLGPGDRRVAVALDEVGTHAPGA